jgi:glycosyltransferase involved in cell wall biosynthesis
MVPLRYCTHGILAIGQKAIDGYKIYGYTRKTFNIPYNIDISLFDRTVLDAQKLENLRRQYQLGDELVFLSSGALVGRKGMDTVIKAFVKATAHKKAHLFILGDGPERPALEKLAAGNPSIHLVGFCEKQDIPYYFALATIFVFASHYDGWGLVINEALAADLAIVCSEETGAAADKLVHGYNALICPADAVDDFALNMEVLLDDPAKRKLLVKHSAVVKEELSSSYNAHKVLSILLNE